MSKDYYGILGIARDASIDEIKKAYRKLAHKHHPDKDGGDETRFKEINEAYQTLSNPQKRAQYDRFGVAFGQGPSGFDFSGFRGGFSGSSGVNFDLNEIFEEIFGNQSPSGFRSRQRTKPHGRDVSVDIQITLEEALRGTVKEVELRKFTACPRCSGDGAEPGTGKKKCADCGGSGEVAKTRQTFFGMFSQVRACPACSGEGEYPEKACKECGGDGRVRAPEKLSIPIPAGIDDNNVIRIREQGERGPRGGSSGDLIIRVSIKKHPVLRRDGVNLYSDLEISFTQAVFGDTVDVRTIDGTVNFKVPAGVQSGTELRLKEKGMPAGDSRRGDYFVKVKIKTPKKLSRKAKKLLEDLKGELS